MNDPFVVPPETYDAHTADFDRLFAPLPDEALRASATQCLSSYLTAIVTRLGTGGAETLLREVCADLGLRPEKAA